MFKMIQVGKRLIQAAHIIQVVTTSSDSKGNPSAVRIDLAGFPSEYITVAEEIGQLLDALASLAKGE